MNEMEVKGKTVEEAIAKGLRELGAPRENVDVRILDEGKSGLFGLLGSPARVRIIPRAAASPHPLREPSESPRQNQATIVRAPVARLMNDLASSAKETLEEILKKMNIPADISVHAEGEGVRLEILSQNEPLLIGKEGQTLDALQTIVRMMLSRRAQGGQARSGAAARFHISVDTEGYRKRQGERLDRLARETATQVSRTRRIVRLDPMSAEARRIIHQALKDHPEVETLSEGEGSRRTVVVKPK